MVFEFLQTLVDNLRTVVVLIQPFPLAQSRRLLQMTLKTHIAR